jgi:5-methylcytosine-specific restriction protein A
MMFLFGNKIRFATRSPKWKTVRKNFLAKNNHCFACGRNKKLEVHHIVPVHVDPSKELEEDNLMVLCDDPCHLVFGHLLDYKSWNENVINDCSNYLEKIQNKPLKT